MGDGNIRILKSGYSEKVFEQKTIYTSSIKMKDDICELILKIGKRPTFWISKVKGKIVNHKNVEYASNRDVFYIRMLKSTTNTFNVIKKSEIDYDGFVYDVTLEKNHTLLIERDGKIWWGSNCYCPQNAFVAMEEYRDTGIQCVNGHSYSSDGASSGNLNFSILATTVFTEPCHNTVGYIENIAKQVNIAGDGGPLVQRFGDLKQGKRSTMKKIAQGATIPSLDCYAGDLGLVMPARQLDAIIEFLDDLGKVIPGMNTDYALLYAPEVKFYSNKVSLDEESMSTVENLYFAGDGSGHTRGLNQASIQGLVFANAILKKNSLS
jgi:uncharacterized FAD-dependent dehydrogenase